MPRPEAHYKMIITAIHTLRKGPFAVYEIAHASGASRPTVTRILDRLAVMGYVTRTKKGFNAQHWRCRDKWLTAEAKDIIGDYEAYQMVRGNASQLEWEGGP